MALPLPLPHLILGLWSSFVMLGLAKIVVSKWNDDSQLGHQSSVSNSGQDPRRRGSDHATDNAWLRRRRHRNLTLNDEREPVSNSGQDPRRRGSDHATDNASLREHLHTSLTSNAERERDGEEGGEEQVSVEISNEEERGNEVEEDPRAEENNGDIKATEYVEKADYGWTGAEGPEKKAEYDWIGAARDEKQNEYEWTGAGEPENWVKYDWIGTNEENKGEYGWTVAGKHDNKDEYGWKGADKHENRDGNGSYYGTGDNNSARKYLYPVRPGAEDCAYYMRTGTCKFGSNCKFKHPVTKKNQAVKEKVKEREDLPENLGQTECKYYRRTRGCRFGNACKYNHSKVKVPVVHQTEELNFLGLPIRKGRKDCPYYMHNGSCKYGANCRLNHPEPTAAGGSDHASGCDNGESATLQSTSRSSVASWSSPRKINETAPFVPLMSSPVPMVPSQSSEWNGFQAPLYPPERSIHPPPAYVMNNAATKTNAYTYHQEPQMVVDQYPERPGQSECVYHMKTGNCKFKIRGKFHHPKSRISKSLPCALSDIGLPFRPGQNICTHYSRFGICKFGSACKFDHPIQQSSSTVSSLDDLHSFGGESSTMAGNGKVNANGTYLGRRQPV